MADNDKRLETREVKLSTPARKSGKRYQEGDTVELYGFEADHFVENGWASESKAKSKDKDK